MGLFGSKKQTDAEKDAASDERHNPITGVDGVLDKKVMKRATRTRWIWCLITSFFLLCSVVFLILLEVGNTYNTGLLKNWYFLRLDVSNVVPASVPNFELLNSIARSLGLHDFYQVGLWNYCEGYDTSGVTNCSPPQTLYYFNPIAIIRSELLAGASIELPSNLTDIVDIIQTASLYMFALFLTGACLSFVMIFIVLLSVFSRWTAFLVMIFTAINAICIIGASVIATVMFVIMQNVFQNTITQVNIGATIGIKMFAFMWVASACALIAFLIQLCLCCCCVSRRDVKKGKKKGIKAYDKASEKTATADMSGAA